MKKLKIKKGYIAGLLTLFLAAAGLHVASAYATNVIDPAEPCTDLLQYPEQIPNSRYSRKMPPHPAFSDKYPSEYRLVGD